MPTQTTKPFHDYGFDIFTLHVIDWHLWLADIPFRRGLAIPHLHISPADWSR